MRAAAEEPALGSNLYNPALAFDKSTVCLNPTCGTWMATGYGARAVEPRLRPSRGLSGVLSEVCVARQYASRYSARCSQASSSWFSSKMISNISWDERRKEERVSEAAFRFPPRTKCLLVCCCKSHFKGHSQRDTERVFRLRQAAHSSVCFGISLEIWSDAGGPSVEHKAQSSARRLSKSWT